MPEKSEIRRSMRLRRKALSPGAKARAAAAVCGKIIGNPSVTAALAASGGRGAIAVYLASPDEIDLTDAIRAMLARGVTVVAPRWNGETYGLAKLKGLADGDLRTGPMGIREPREGDSVAPKDVAVWLVPGLAFARTGERLGYGGGWYDRLLAEADAGSLKIGVAHAFQVVARLPSEPHDIRLDALLFH